MIEGKVVYAPLLYSTQTPINLLGRDILCSLKVNIMCSPDGIHISFPNQPQEGDDDALINTGKRDSEQLPINGLLDKTDPARVYVETSLGAMQLCNPTISSLALHCTLKFDPNQSDTDYEECWDQLVNKKQLLITTEDIYIGPQGGAAAVTLPEHLAQWFQVQNSVPHVTLLIEQGYESHDLGPMVKTALQVSSGG